MKVFAERFYQLSVDDNRGFSREYEVVNAFHWVSTVFHVLPWILTMSHVPTFT